MIDIPHFSVKESWLSASEKNNGDVKELIPEFFYLPEFLRNTNRFDFGVKQNGEVRCLRSTVLLNIASMKLNP